MKLLTKEWQGSCKITKICYVCNVKIGNRYLKDIVKLEIFVIIQENIEMLHIAYVI